MAQCAYRRNEMTPMNDANAPVLAAIDLGSNSFHMIIARLRDGQFQVMDRLKEMVQLRAGLDEDGILSLAAQQRALACLERFGERLTHLDPDNIRAVGTNTLRVAKNSQQFLRKARQALQHPIEIVAGEEEARLIYLGVAHSMAFDAQRRLVIDIGGGSTEYIIGEGFTGLQRESLEMGCVSFSQRFFAGGRVTHAAMDAAIIAAGRQLRDIQRPYRKMGWYEAIGASGTMRSVAQIVAENGWAEDGVITREAVDRIIHHLITTKQVTQLQLPGLTEERKSVIAGGIAVLKASFERLKLARLKVSDGALREGVLYDLLGRKQHDDERERTVESLMRRYHVDRAHARRVERMAMQLLQQVASAWALDKAIYRERLAWACRLHEVGLAISHQDFHRHSAYLIQHSDMPGFSREEQLVLATMMRGQRKKFPKKAIEALPEELQSSTLRLTLLLRLAMVFNRGRSEQTDTYISIKRTQKGLKLRLPTGWLTQHPLTAADLQQEKYYLKKIDIKLKLQDD